MKKVKSIILIVLAMSLLTSCSQEEVYEKYSDSFFDTFDTITQIVGYTKTEEEFDEYMEFIHDRFLELHKYYDKYNNYEGINNIKTINDNAGIEPVEVNDDIMDMIKYSLEWNEKTGGNTDILIGPVMEIWNDHRSQAEADPENAKMPDMEKLEEASQYMDPDKLIVDEENMTIYLEDENMSIDVGAIAKGYATEVVAREVEELGMESVLIGAGGNIRAVGQPMDDRSKWGIGIQNPDEDLIDLGRTIDTVFIDSQSVVSSGDYQRYYFVGDQRMHHIIDPNTLMPGDYYRAVTVVTPDSGLADFLSTAIFLLPYEESFELVESLEDVDALWVMKDGEIRTTDGLKEIMKSEGATGD